MKTPVLNTVVIDGGRLIFDRDQEEVSLQAHHILLRNNGYLQIGTPEDPFLNKAEIVLHGKKLDKQFMHFGNKVISAINSKIDIHGQPRDHTWTYVATTIAVWDVSFSTTVEVDWQVGDVIVVAATGYEMDEAETRTITAVTSTTEFTVDRPFKNRHYSAVETYGEKEFPMYCEVALISRNVVVKGADHDSIDTTYGGHMMLMGSAMEGTRGRFSYMEMY